MTYIVLKAPLNSNQPASRMTGSIWPLRTYAICTERTPRTAEEPADPESRWLVLMNSWFAFVDDPDLDTIRHVLAL